MLLEDGMKYFFDGRVRSQKFEQILRAPAAAAEIFWGTSRRSSDDWPFRAISRFSLADSFSSKINRPLAQ
ncbi:MAG: hypothetical protein AAB853_05190 [Patescibacteria group bacterium]